MRPGGYTHDSGQSGSTRPWRAPGGGRCHARPVAANKIGLMWPRSSRTKTLFLPTSRWRRLQARHRKPVRPCSASRGRSRDARSAHHEPGTGRRDGVSSVPSLPAPETIFGLRASSTTRARHYSQPSCCHRRKSFKAVGDFIDLGAVTLRLNAQPLT